MQGRERVWTDEDYASPPEYAGWDGHTRMAWMAGDYTFAKLEEIRDYVWEVEEAGQGEAFHALRRDLYARYSPHGQPPVSDDHADQFYRKVWWLDPPGGSAPAGQRRPDTRIGYWDGKVRLSEEEAKELLAEIQAELKANPLS